jgi:tRNA(Ser,Leu) C12 N-acetylase TAN1
VIHTKNFNLLISTSRFNETNANTELWFVLLICGDNFPIISKSTFSGLTTALSNIDSKQIVHKIREIVKINPTFFQFILKIVPIDFVCETNPKIIANLVEEHYKTYIKDTDSFKIVLKRRKHEKIKRESIIKRVAQNIDNKVNLEDPDKTIRIEVLGNFSGISFLEKNDVIRIED